MADTMEFGADLGRSIEAPTMQLRWVPKSMMQAMDLKLQQAWTVTLHDKDGKPWKSSIEWRDVPVVY